MDPNQWPVGANFDDLPLWSPSATMDYTLDFSTQEFDSFATQLPPINIGSESYQREMVYFDHNVGTNGSHLVDLPMPSVHTDAAMDYDLDFLNNEAVNFCSDQNVSFVSDLGYTDSLLPSSVTPISNNPLMEIVEAATSFSLGQTRRATDNSSRGNYMKFSREDVAQMIRGVGQHGKRWKKISQLPYFKDSGRTKDQLMGKWRHMTETDDDNKDPETKDLYSWAKLVDDALRQEKMN